jgi:RNA polymerase sigma factor (sigma-70 family)
MPNQNQATKRGGVRTGGNVTRQEYGDVYEKGGFQETVQRLADRGIDRDHANDLAQSAWVRGWERLSQLRDSRLLVAWVNAIALNLFRDGAASHTPMRKLCAQDELVSPSTIDLVAIDVRRTLQICNPRQRQVLQWIYLDGHSTVDVAKRSGKSIGAVHSELLRARRALRKKMTLAQGWGLPPGGTYHPFG